MDERRIRVAVLYGGRSSEHDVSRESAKCVLDHLDATRYEVVPIAVDREGRWHVQDYARLKASHAKALPVEATADTVALATHPGRSPLEGSRAPSIDVVFPIMHGPSCEDGSLQGLLELAEVPYVGAGVLGSAVCMDKDVAKRLARAAGLETTDYLCVRRAEWAVDRRGLTARAVDTLGLPLFVKPANLGSSVGIHRVSEVAALGGAVDDALRYDAKILIERTVVGREIELAVLSAPDEAADPEVSLPGEIVPDDAFYSYERKYLESAGAKLLVPAPLAPDEARAAQALARRAFVALECEPMARIDFFRERGSGRWLFSEANTIPGFTTISMYPKLWEASGLSYPELLDRLIRHALRRGERQRALDRGR